MCVIFLLKINLLYDLFWSCILITVLALPISIDFFFSNPLYNVSSGLRLDSSVHLSLLDAVQFN